MKSKCENISKALGTMPVRVGKINYPCKIHGHKFEGESSLQSLHLSPG